MGWARAACLCLVTLLLWTSRAESKVYYGCGAVLNPSGRDLIISPGYPNNYLPDSHCLWQIFVPAGAHIVLEILDFDIYESSSDNNLASNISFDSHSDFKMAMDQTTLTYDLQKVSIDQDDYGADTSKNESKTEPFMESQNLILDPMHPSQRPRTSFKELLSTGQKNHDLVNQDKKPMNPLASVTGRMTTNFAQQVNEGATSPSINPESDPITITPPVLEVCPLDVLYITDLITFSSRFCGSNSPVNKNLTFGSSVEMIEVILELITTTNHGRGFALLFTYHNQSMLNAMGVKQSSGRDGVVLLVVGAAVISFGSVLLLVLCLAYRQKMCHKKKESDVEVTTQVSGIQNTGMDINELQLVVPEHLQNLALESAVQAADVSQQMTQEDPNSSTITATDSHSDEVFVISAGNGGDCFTFNTYPLQEGSLKRSVTSPASVSDCLNSNYTSVDLSLDDRVNEVEDVDAARQRTWSVRTFNSLLPQLQMKWRSRSSSGSFTKLVDTCCSAPAKTLNSQISRRAGSDVQIGENSTRLFSESSDSNASYPLTQSAQLHRKLPLCNLKRTRPYFGLLNTSSDSERSGQKFLSVKENHTSCQTSAMEFKNSAKTLGNGVRAKELPVDFEKPNTVFVICEEADDQQPLVLDDQLISPVDDMSKNNDNIIKVCSNEDGCYLESSNPGSFVSPWIHSSGASPVHCMENKASDSAQNNSCTTVNRPSSVISANCHSADTGFISD